MKKGLTKILALMFALLFVLAVLGGCGGKKKTEDPVDDPNTEDPIDEEPGDEEPAGEKIDLDGEATIFATWWDNNPAIGTPMADLTLALNEKYNTSILWQNVAANEYYQKFTAGALSGNPETHVTMLRSQWMPSLMRKGLLYDLTEWVDFSDTATYKEYYTRLAGELNGRIYGVRFGAGREMPFELIVFNKALAEREGIPNIYELYKSKQWTFEKFLEFAQKVTKDTDGDGEVDQWGIRNISPLTLMYNNGAQMTRAEGDDVFVAFDSDESIEALQFYQDLHIKHKVVGGGDEAWNAGKTLFRQAYQFEFNDIKANLADEFGVVYYPLGPKGDKYTSVKEEVKVYVLASSDKKAKEHFTVAKELLKKQPNPDGEPDPPLIAVYENMVFDQDSAEILLDIELNGTVITDYLAWQDWSSSIWNMFGEISNGDATPQAAVDGIKDQMQAGIDATLSE